MGILRQGSKGAEVQELQEDLKSVGFYQHKIDGEFGRLTRQAVMAFQGRYLVDGIVDKHTASCIVEAVASWTLYQPRIMVTIPNGIREIEKQFGKIEFTEAGAGAIYIVNDWAEENIVAHNFPVIGKHLVHYKIVGVLEAIMEELQSRGLDGEILQAGIWCPRHKMHNSNRGLSTHSWGIAIDLNQATNPPGARGDLNIEIVEVFELYGWEWGGRWTYPDSMHLQACKNW